MDSTVRIMDLGWALNAPNGPGERGAGYIEVAFCF